MAEVTGLSRPFAAKSAGRAEGRDRIRLGGFSAHRLFLLLAPLLYAAYALITPPFQTPDEHQHLFRAWQLSEFRLIGERRGDEAGGVLPAGLGRAALPEIGSLEPNVKRRIIGRPVETAFVPSTLPGAGGSRFFDFRGSAVYSPAGYMPQVCSIWIGKAADLSVENVVRLGRLLNAALAILLIYFAIRVTPVGALAMVWVGLLPMSAGAAASFGQDGVVIGGGCLLTAIGLRTVLNGRFERRELLVSATLAMAMTLAKFVYLPLVLIGGLPFIERKREWRRLLTPFLICVAASGLAALWLHAASTVAAPPSPNIPPVGERLAAWAKNPGTLLILLEHTFIWHGGTILESLFTFGWLNVAPDPGAEILSAAALCVTFLVGDPEASRLSWKTRLWLLSLAVAIVAVIGIALYLFSRPASDTWIQGFQGRYLLPLAPSFLLAALPSRAHPPAYRSLVPLMMVGANLFALRTIFLTFYF